MSYPTHGSRVRSLPLEAAVARRVRDDALAGVEDHRSGDEVVRIARVDRDDALDVAGAGLVGGDLDAVDEAGGRPVLRAPGGARPAEQRHGGRGERETEPGEAGDPVQ